MWEINRSYYAHFTYKNEAQYQVTSGAYSAFKWQSELSFVDSETKDTYQEKLLVA